MSGHSKWANIKHKKGALDAKRGKIFTRHAKLIEIAAREGGGGDISMNSKLAVAVENAKLENVPNANIDRAIKKGTGELKGDITVAVTYEAYGPGGTAYIIECLTDNKNRSLGNVRSIIDKRGGRWAESGSVMFQFERKGVVVGEKKENVNEETELALIEAGADDIDQEGDTIEVVTDATKWTKVRDALAAAKITILEAGLKFIPKQKVPVTDAETARKVLDFMEAVEEDEDVSEIHTNAEFSKEVLAELGK